MPHKEENQLVWLNAQESSPIKKIENELKKKRMVQSEVAEKINQAKPDVFLGRQNQRVDRETVNQKKTIEIGRSTQVASRTVKRKAQLKILSHLGVQVTPAERFAASEQPQWATPGTRPEDYIKGMRESDRTALNTSEYLFYTYYQRIRERLDRAWVPILREKLGVYYGSGRRLAGDMDHTTKVMVVLNGQGEIVRVLLASESGTRDLDDAAVSAFNKAGPFPNPPRGMVDANGEVHIPWDFILKT